MKFVRENNKKRNGFTLIEISLFIAISGLLLVGIMASTRTIIGNQEDNDSVQNFANFLRDLYASTINPQHDYKGNSDEAVYGYAAIFGADSSSKDGNTKVDTYLVTGPADFTNDAQSYEKIYIDDIDGFKLTKLDTYYTSWGAQIKNTKSVNNDYRGSIIIMHNPTGSGINTYRSKSTNASDAISDMEELYSDEIFCIANGDETFSRGVKISAHGQNASAVSILDKDDGRCHEN